MKLTLSRSFPSKVAATPRVVSLANMFGIGVDETHNVVLYKDLELEVRPGWVVYITGESGAGKSCLLRDIAVVAERDDGFTPLSLAIKDVPKTQPIIDVLDVDLREGVRLLMQAGIGEPFVMMRCWPELSDGQKYRFAMALLMRDAERVENPIVFADEFLAVLDRTQAKVIAYQIRKLASRRKIAFVVATTHQDLEEDLDPNVVVTMRQQSDPEVQKRLWACIQ